MEIIAEGRIGGRNIRVIRTHDGMEFVGPDKESNYAALGIGDSRNDAVLAYKQAVGRMHRPKDHNSKMYRVDDGRMIEL